MFYVVQLDSDIFKEKIVVPSTWLDKYDTLCLLPPVTDVVEIETLAKAQSMPKHGWQMHSLSFMQSFDTYSQAKEYITKGKPVMIELEKEEEEQYCKEVRGKRKRKLPRFLEQYVIDSDPNKEEDNGTKQDDCSMEDNTVPDPLIVKIETIEDFNVPEDLQQPRLNTTHNKSSSSVHSSLQHGSQLQVAGSSSTTMRLSLGITPPPSSESVIDEKCSNCSHLEKKIKTMEQEIVSLKRILMDFYQTTNIILTSMNKMEKEDILQRIKDFQRLKTTKKLATFIEKLKDNEVFSKMTMNTDPRGVKRGNCLSENCDCTLYEYEGNSGPKCSYCFCPPTKHQKMEVSVEITSDCTSAEVIAACSDNDYISDDELIYTSEESIDNQACASKPLSKKGSGKTTCFQLPEFSNVLKPLLEGETLSKKDHAMLSSTLKEELIAYLNRENLICNANSSSLRWQYRNLGESLALKYPRMLFDLQSSRQKKSLKEKAPIYSVFLRRLSQRRKMQRLRQKNKDETSTRHTVDVAVVEVSPEDSLCELKSVASEAAKNSENVESINELLKISYDIKQKEDVSV